MGESAGQSTAAGDRKGARFMPRPFFQNTTSRRSSRVIRYSSRPWSLPYAVIVAFIRHQAAFRDFISRGASDGDDSETLRETLLCLRNLASHRVSQYPPLFYMDRHGSRVSPAFVFFLYQMYFPAFFLDVIRLKAASAIATAALSRHASQCH
jgi:hypothetical protein